MGIGLEILTATYLSEGIFKYSVSGDTNLYVLVERIGLWGEKSGGYGGRRRWSEEGRGRWSEGGVRQEREMEWGGHNIGGN